MFDTLPPPQRCAYEERRFKCKKKKGFLLQNTCRGRIRAFTLDYAKNAKVETVPGVPVHKETCRFGGREGEVAVTSAATCQTPLSKGLGKVDVLPLACTIVPKHMQDNVSTYFWL